MSRNGSGNYTLPQPAFVANTKISSAAMNSDLTDIAAALTQSFSADGQTPFTGIFKNANGTSSNPSYTFNSDQTTGVYLVGGGQIGFSTGGIQAMTINADQSVTLNGALHATGIGGIPVGSVMSFAGSSAPAGWQLCAGQAISRTTYASLFAVIGTAYGSGDGSTTFNVPDYRGRVLAGKDDMGGSAAGRIGTVVTDNGTIVGTTLGSTGGSSTHVQATGELAQHNHTDSGHTHVVTADDNTSVQGGVNGGNAGTFALFTTSSPAHSITSASGTANIQNTGSSTAMAWLQPTAIANKIIFAGV